MKEFEDKAISDLVKVLLQPNTISSSGYNYGDAKKPYEELRQTLINEYGYDSFREWQKVAFKRIQDQHWKAK